MKVLIIKANPKTNEVQTDWLEGSDLLTRADRLTKDIKRNPEMKDWDVHYLPITDERE